MQIRLNTRPIIYLWIITVMMHPNPIEIPYIGLMTMSIQRRSLLCAAMRYAYYLLLVHVQNLIICSIVRSLIFIYLLLAQSETISLASARIFRANEIDDLTKFEEQAGFVSIGINNQPMMRSNSPLYANMPEPVAEDGRQLYWPKTVMKRPSSRSTSFRYSEPLAKEHLKYSEPYDRYDVYNLV